MNGTENVYNKCFWNPEEAGKIKVKRRAWERVREAADHDPDIQLCESLECDGCGYPGVQSIPGGCLHIVILRKRKSY